MIVVTSKGWALFVEVVGLVMLGTWPAIWNYIERKGRLPVHTFIDYGIVYFLTAFFTSLILGEPGHMNPPGVPNFLAQLSEPIGKAMAFVIAGGAVLAIGNICLMYAVALAGLAVALPIISGLSLVLGATLNYLLDNGLNRAEILFPGVGCAFVAICLGSATHLARQKALKKRFVKAYKPTAGSPPPAADDSAHGTIGGKAGVELSTLDKAPSSVDIKASTLDKASTPDTETMADALEVGMPNHMATMVDPDAPVGRVINAAAHNKLKGLVLAVISGLCIAFFSPSFNVCTNDHFKVLPEGVAPPSVQTANFYFAMSFAFVGIVANVFFLYYPPLGAPPSTLKAWLFDNNWRLLGILAGVLNGLGNLAEFLGGEAAGFAAAAMVQSFPMVSTIWGVVLFKEFKNTSKTAVGFLIAEITFYIASIILLGTSAKTRS